MTRVAILVDAPDWHTRRLTRALEARGAEARALSLADCGLAAAGPALPGFPARPPEAAFVRIVPAGSFEQVTLWLGVLHALGELGVLVYNDARAIERCVDKSATGFLLDRAGLPTPPAWAAASREAAAALVRDQAAPGAPLVLKPLFGSQGRGLRLIERPEDLPPPEEVAGAYYLQRFVGSRDGDWRDRRVFVVGGRAIAAMERRGRDWRTNAARGAHCAGIAVGGEMAQLAAAATAAVGAAYAGVDLIVDRQGGLQVLEVNSMPAWAALERAAAVDVGDALAADLLARLGAGRRVLGAPAR